MFDEIDAICRPRGMGGDQAVGMVYDGLVNQLLSLLDGVDALDNILVVGMTNRKDLIDPALLRPGRLEVDIQLKLPEAAARLQILRIHTRHTPLAADVSLADLAARCVDYSGAELAALCREGCNL